VVHTISFGVTQVKEVNTSGVRKSQRKYRNKTSNYRDPIYTYLNERKRKETKE